MNNLPDGVSEADALAEIDKIAKVLSAKFSFGSYEREDIEQEARLIGWRLLNSGKFNAGRGNLGSWLYQSIRNRLGNLKRREHSRLDSPCPACFSGKFCTGTDEPCKRHRKFARMQHSKAALASNCSPDMITDEKSPHIDNEHEQNVEIDDLLKLLDKKLNLDDRKTMLQIRSGVVVPHHARARLMEAVADFFDDSNLPIPDFLSSKVRGDNHNRKKRAAFDDVAPLIGRLRFDEHLSLDAIAERLNEAGVRKKNGRPWSGVNVRYVLLAVYGHAGPKSLPKFQQEVPVENMVSS